jgi:hypothetical protein
MKQHDDDDDDGDGNGDGNCHSSSDSDGGVDDDDDNGDGNCHSSSDSDGGVDDDNDDDDNDDGDGNGDSNAHLSVTTGWQRVSQVVTSSGCGSEPQNSDLSPRSCRSHSITEQTSFSTDRTKMIAASGVHQSML